MNKMTPKRDYFKIWEVLILTAVTPAIAYGVLALNNVPVV